MQTVPPPVKKLILRNIQSLPKAEIELGPPGTMTTVIGESDTGKTTLASRSLQKLFFNTIPTKELIRRGAKSASITAVYDTPDNSSVTWEWKSVSPDRGKARYIITRDNMDPIILEGSNRPGNVPEAIQELTGVRPVKIGNLTLNFNFNRQLDGPFLGNVSPTERYRVLGALAGTLEVDEAVKEVGLEIHRARRNEKELAGEIDNLSEQIREYDYLVELKDVIEKVETGLASIRHKMGHRDKLIALQIEIEAKQKLTEEAGNTATALGRMIEQANQELNQVESNMARHSKLVVLLQTTRQTQQQIFQADSILDVTKSTSEIAAALNRLTENHAKLITLTKLRQAITSEHQKLTAAQQILDTTRATEQAQIAVERLSEANHTLGRLVPLWAGITKARERIKRNTVTLEATEWVELGQQILDSAIRAIDTLGKLKDLALNIQSVRTEKAKIDALLQETKDVARGFRVLAEVEAGLARLIKLREINSEIHRKVLFISDKQNFLDRKNEQVMQAREEYRALLLEAGICEDCPVVDAVMAAAN